MQIKVDGKEVFSADNVKSLSISTPRGPAAVDVGVEKGDLIEVTTKRRSNFNRPLDDVEAEIRQETREKSYDDTSTTSTSSTSGSGTKKTSTSSKKSE